MYMLVVTWLTLTPPHTASQNLYLYKSLEQCRWAKQWVAERNDLKPTWNLQCIAYENISRD